LSSLQSREYVESLQGNGRLHGCLGCLGWNWRLRWQHVVILRRGIIWTPGWSRHRRLRRKMDQERDLPIRFDIIQYTDK
jgi:hypothetical protein